MCPVFTATAEVTDQEDEGIPEVPQQPSHSTVSSQWEDPSLWDHSYGEQQGVEETAEDATTQTEDFSYSMLQSDADSFLYTGVSLETFNSLVSTLEGFAERASVLSVRDQILMTLIKLKLNRVLGDLGRQFHVSQSVASKVISFWIDKMEEVLRPLIIWLPKETIKATMPTAFKRFFPNTTCVIDCSESLLQKAKNLDSRGESYSHYYSHNTIKYLVVVAPCGLIMFISSGYGGRASDKFITMNSGILDYLRPGDEVMADRGFLIRDLLFERRVKLVLPAFTRGGSQLTEEQVTATRRIANVRIHVERAIRRLKVYKILSHVIPINMTPKIEKILRICAALANLRGDLICER
ncbi:uncharacterized protein LOC132465617 isoform X2 [Gadus macrocephalus]|uniref:uncharacterized protein LOC132448382 isoform X2 n=1 Tax=Gadus macrocephalus TaxID=80720 RepID=UPI0028CB3E63|nr:uncharacterized protein LOC132448382 isoform X2 [Gadus macrocephalus]XP_059918297.1 uncharacterized protein LOC132465617 isoform X2 [Gadus macrocephalus]